MGKHKGIVTKIGDGKFGYYLRLQGDDRYFNTKFEPKCNEGDEVGITSSREDGQRVQIKAIKVLREGVGVATGGSGGGGRAAGDRNTSIVMQSAQLRAAELLQALIAVGFKGKEEVVLAKFDELTYRCFVDAIDPENGPLLQSKKEIEAELDEAEDTSGDAWDDGDDWS